MRVFERGYVRVFVRVFVRVPVIFGTFPVRWRQKQWILLPISCLKPRPNLKYVKRGGKTPTPFSSIIPSPFSSRAAASVCVYVRASVVFVRVLVRFSAVFLCKIFCSVVVEAVAVGR